MSRTLAVLLDALPLDRRTRIVDVGANPLLDEAPYAALLRAGACDVVGFEPQPAAFAALMAAKSNNETYYPFAVGDGSTVELKIYRSGGYSSVFDPYMPGLAHLGGGKWAKVVDRIRFDTVALDSSEVGVFDLLKIDIQGGECAVFRGAETSLQAATAVIVEMRYARLYDGEPMMGGVDAELTRQGFALHKFLFTKSRALPNSQSHRLREKRLRDQAVDGDAVYLRDLSGISDYSDTQLMHLCVTACAVFDSPTLVLYALDALQRRGKVPADLAAAFVDALPPEVRRDTKAAS